MEFITKSSSETKKLGKTFAANLAGGDILALTGNLGSGKTTFIQGLAEGLGVSTRVISPTFILLRKYIYGDRNFYHVDLYRLEEKVENEVVNLGLTDIWERSNNIVVVEWAEKVKRLIPKSALWITFESLGGDKRKIILKK
ncbi:tRNA (adenosine(37)-N6)-threonylcarbamoyltransferase complex ATPase subunit type 1 TsaE [Candidatus Woesebacteria bacterium GWA1_42_12]|uniref:tRNA threonylcarbamoyladenosine biosynthesis protein TsaE n=1 Tax=Candidatus Woesebacteria bacterium GWA1_42_12 TaxID=1802472 RepID=A0A1F7WNB5_9BACT|nr:MAG: tRNA (adenosine(37)-N6)-threonylcarbamoyltransferase complex ATPase subunit type 1 TsaE [Candidatus Woesebacteria bacterium GWA1_42_12]